MSSILKIKSQKSKLVGSGCWDAFLGLAGWVYLI